MEGSARPMKRAAPEGGAGAAPAAKRGAAAAVAPEEDDYDAEEGEEGGDQDDFFDEFEKELMQAGDDGEGGTPRAAGGVTPRGGASTPRAFGARTPGGGGATPRGGGRMSPPPPRPAGRGPTSPAAAVEAPSPRAAQRDAATPSGTPGRADEGAAATEAEDATPAKARTAAAAAAREQAGPGESDPEDEMAQQLELAQRNRAILNKLNDVQLHRYEQYRRSTLQKDNMRKLVQHITNKDPLFAVNDKSLIVICGVAKIYVGELIETARSIATALGHTGALEPFHIRAAYRKLDGLGKIPHRGGPRRLKL
eukprot:jgi/Tetstr1/461680/TSEL_006780.t1